MSRGLPLPVLVCVACTVCLTCTTVPEEPSSRAIAFERVTVIPMDSERRIEDATVLVRDGKIVDVGPGIAVPRGALRIDGRGKFLLPGLIDSYSHGDSEAFFLPYLANGVTTVRTAGGTTIHLGLRDRAASGEVLGPRQLATGPAIEGEPPAWISDEGVASAPRAEQVVRDHHRLGFDGVMIYNTLDEEAFRAAVRTAGEVGLPVTGHFSRGSVAVGVAASGQRSFENLVGMVDFATGEARVPEDRLERLGAALRDAGIYIIPTLAVHKVRGAKDGGRRFAEPGFYRFFPPAMRLEASTGRRLGPQEEYHYGGAAHIVGALHRAGTKIVAGTDAGYPYVLHGFSMQGPDGELRNLVEAGLSNYEALLAATRTGAEFLALADRIGTIAPGKEADLLLLDADPLENIDNAARITGVMTQGRWLPREELVARMEALARSYEAPRDRFAGMRPLTGEGTEEFAASYVIRHGGRVVGEEEVVLRRLGPSRRVLASRASIDPYHDVRTWAELELEGASVRRVRIERTAADGTADLAIEAAGEVARVTGARPYYGAIDLTLPHAPGDLLGGPVHADEVTSDLVANWVLAAERIASGERTIGFDLIELNAGEHLERATAGETTWTVRDGGGAWDVELPGRAGTGSQSARLFLDPSHRPVRIEIGDEIVIERVEDRA